MDSKIRGNVNAYPNAPSERTIRHSPRKYMDVRQHGIYCESLGVFSVGMSVHNPGIQTDDHVYALANESTSDVSM